jgi:hypothetical protein
VQGTELFGSGACGGRLRGSGLCLTQACDRVDEGDELLRELQQLPRLRRQRDADGRQGCGGVRSRRPVGVRTCGVWCRSRPACSNARAASVYGPPPRRSARCATTASRSAAAHAASLASLGSAPPSTVAVICVAARVAASCAACHSRSRS